MLKLAGLGTLNALDYENLDRFYNQAPPLNEKERSHIFSTFSRIYFLWGTIFGAMPASWGCVNAGLLLYTGHFFTVTALPTVALVVAGIVAGLMLMASATDILDAGYRAERIAGEGGILDDDTPFSPSSVDYIIQKSSFPRICDFLIRKAKE